MKTGFVSLGLLLVAQAALAQGYQDRERAPERAAALNGLQRGKSIKGSRDDYQQLTQVFAVARASSSEKPAQALARIGEGGAQVIETKGKLVLYRSARSGTASTGRSGQATLFPTVVNVQSGALGVLTGALIVKPKSMADAAAIGSSHALETVKAYPQLQTVFYKAGAGVDLADVSAALQADPRVESAYPEIIERVRVPK